MTTPLQVDPNDVQITAGSVGELQSELGGSIPPGTSMTVFPTGAVTALIHANTAAATALMHNRVGHTSSQLAGSAQHYQGADQQNAGQLKGGGLGEAIKLGEVGQILGPIFQPLQSVLQAAAQISQGFIGVLGSGVGELMNPLTGAIGAAISAGATVQTHGATAGAPGAASGLLGSGTPPPEQGAHSTAPLHTPHPHLRAETQPQHAHLASFARTDPFDHDWEYQNGPEHVIDPALGQSGVTACTYPRDEV